MTKKSSNYKSKPCKSNQIRNPATNRCVKKSGKIGKSLLGEPIKNTKSCKPDQIRNPATNRCVKKTGKIGKMLLKQNKSNSSPRIKSISKTPTKRIKQFSPLAPKKIIKKKRNKVKPIPFANLDEIKLEVVDLKKSAIAKIKRKIMEIKKKRYKPRSFTQDQIDKKTEKFFQDNGESETIQCPEAKVDTLTLLSECFTQGLDPTLLNKKELCNIRFRYPNAWLTKQKEWMRKLDSDDVVFLKGYTYQGDKVLNEYHRAKDKNGKAKFKLGLLDNVVSEMIAYEHQWIEFIDESKLTEEEIEMWDNLNNETSVYDVKKMIGSEYELCNSLFNKWIEFVDFEMNALFKSAPKTDTSLLVFRGVKGTSFLKKDQNNLFQSKGYTSTSLDMKSAEMFANMYEADGAFLMIRIPKGSRLIWLGDISRYPEEKEVLLPRNSGFINRGVVKKHNYWVEEDEYISIEKGKEMNNMVSMTFVGQVKKDLKLTKSIISAASL